MAVLNAVQRRVSQTLPGGRYPIPDKAHARVALARINQGRLSSSQKAKVRAKAKRMLYGSSAIHAAIKQRGGR